MNRKKTKLNISLSNEEKKFIIEEAEKKGYQTTSAFLIHCAYKHIEINIDTSSYMKYEKQVRAIGYNINTLIRDIRIGESFTFQDLESLKNHLNNIEELLKKEKQSIDELESKTEKLSDEEIISILKKNKKEIPLKYVYENLMNDIREMLYQIIELGNQENINKNYLMFIENWLIAKFDLDNFDYEMMKSLSDDLFVELSKMQNLSTNIKKGIDDNKFKKIVDILQKY